MDMPHSVCSSGDGHLGCFYLLALVNSARNTGVPTFVLSSYFQFPSGIAGSRGDSMLNTRVLLIAFIPFPSSLGAAFRVPLQCKSLLSLMSFSSQKTRSRFLGMTSSLPTSCHISNIRAVHSTFRPRPGQFLDLDFIPLATHSHLAYHTHIEIL